jgi:hypothetical protein
MPLTEPAFDVATGQMGVARVIETARWRRWRLRARFGVRYVENALRGRPEPAFPHFRVTACALLSSVDGSRLLTLPGEDSAAGQLRALPRVALSGAVPPWAALSAHLTSAFGIGGPLRWAGVWQDAQAHALEFVFAGRCGRAGRGEWAAARTVALHGRDADYLRRAGESAPWCIEELH